MITWDNAKLEPVLITFNRAQHLEKTLRAFFDAGLTSMRLHVLDNASTDETPEVVARFQAQWQNLHYHRNKYNIGGNANILRAVEISNSEYHWVIGDDDEWYLSHTNELIDILKNTAADVIRLGWQASGMSRGKTLDSEIIRTQEKMFFGSLSMISATILRRSLVTRYLCSAYANISNFYQQIIPVVLANQNEKISVHTLKNDLMLHTPNSTAAYFLGDLEWYTIWYKTGLFFCDEKKRAKFNQETIHYARFTAKNHKLGLPPWLSLIRICLYFKSLRISQSRYLVEIFLYGKGVRWIFFLPACAYFLTPGFLAAGLRNLYQKIYKLPVKNPKRDTSR
ncbi:MAG: glycosyltransferase [uncultured bacterium]|nr:MAG: glycosyltransferase [uncultured bacterium]